MKPVFLLSAVMLALVSGCTAPAQATSPTLRTPVQNLITEGEIETTATGQCFARTAPPTRIRIIGEQILVTPGIKGDDGTFTSPPIFRNQTRPITEVIGQGTRFETLCPPEYTRERVATLQRALKARLAYGGPITSVLDSETRAAIQALQAAQGFDSPLIERGIAEKFGIVSLDRTTL
ncbi:peptidoglycan-binding protein [Yoonia sp.]|uniref:peptidoglycan-binding protein n=1 Tax=Yoonia sp. TaxID=2212373 RepID=UPI00239F1D67|nr:peptidoglycan-binding protein [Yoonia sp.]MDE0850814.1 peptidoglycan-binding protein [Yoonia sp.]